MVVWTPHPAFPDLRCRVCGVAKKQLDRNDDIVIDKGGNFAAGTWFCQNGHANKI